MSEKLIPPSFLFRLAVPCYEVEERSRQAGVRLSDQHVMPSFDAELNLGPRFAELRLGWSDLGLFVDLRVTSKKQSPWCRKTRLDDSDGLMLLIDTRNTQSIHRATRFCHRFVLLPQGSGRLLKDPTIELAKMARAKEHPKPVPEGSLQIASQKRIDGYLLQALIGAEALTGFDPMEHPRLGFSYAVIDRELGWQTFSLDPSFPFLSDPSLWGTLTLTPK